MTPTTCDDYEILIERELANALPVEDATLLHAHLQTCARCTEYRRAAADSSATLRTVSVQIPAPARRQALDEKLRLRNRFFDFDWRLAVISALMFVGYLGALIWFQYPFVTEFLVTEAIVVTGATALLRSQRAKDRKALLSLASTTDDMLAAHRAYLVRIRKEARQARLAYIFMAIIQIVMFAASSSMGVLRAQSVVLTIGFLAAALTSRFRVEPRMDREIADLGGAV